MVKKENSNNNIAVFFGAGAEVDYDQPAGNGFLEKILRSKYKKQREKLVKGSGKQYCQLVNANSTKVFIQTIVQNKDLAHDYGIDEETISMMDNYYQGSDKPKYAEIRKKCNEWYKEIVGTSIENDSGNREKHKDFFLENAVFFDALDSKFNSLRNSDKDNISLRVINTYLIIFLFMLEKNYDLDINEESELTYDDIISVFGEDKKRKVFNIDNKMTYYRTIREYKNQISHIRYNIITTNYTNIAEQEIFGQDYSDEDEKIIHLHGKLCLFEDIERLTIYDCSDERQREIALQRKDYIFPYILIPSGVKPIICRKQIETFHQFNIKMEESNILIVVGYQFNLEDNHINSMIADWLRDTHEGQERRMIYFDYGKSMKWDKHKIFSDFINGNDNRLHLKDNCEIDENLKMTIMEMIHSPKSSGKIISIEFDKNQSTKKVEIDVVKVFQFVLECCTKGGL